MFDGAFELIKKGREGNAVRIPFPFSKLSSHIGISPHLYFLVGGDSGTGKSAFVHSNFVMHPYEWVTQNPQSGIKIKIFLWAMERPKDVTVVKWICQKLWLDHGILVDVPTMLSWQNDNTCPDHIFEKVSEVREYFKKMSEMVTIIDSRMNPTGIYYALKDYAARNGTEFDKHGNPIDPKDTRKKACWNYEPNDPNLITIVICDHFGLPKLERGHSTKQNIDKLSDYFQIFRDRYKFVTVGVSQFNRNLRDVYRRKNLLLQPEPSDFEHSSRPYHDADVVIGLLSPHKYNLKTYLDYKVESFISPNGHNRFRTGVILKNSYGIDDLHFGLHFIGENGLFRELPKASELTNQDYFQLATLGQNKSFEDRFDFGDIDFG